MSGAEEDELEANAAGGGIHEKDDIYSHNNKNTNKPAHHASSSMCGPNYSSSATVNDDHAMASNPTSKKANRNGAIAVSSFVDQAFSLDLPGHNIRLVSVPAHKNARNSSDLDDDDYEEEGGDDDAKGPFLTSYYPLVPLLLSLCFPVLVLYQHYSRSCLNFDAAASAAATESASDSVSNEDESSKNQSWHAQSSMLQNFVVANLLRLLLAIALVVYGPAVKFQVDRSLRRFGRTSAWLAMEGTLRRITAYVWGRSDDQYRYSSADNDYAPTSSSLFLGSGGYNRERTASGSSFGGSNRSTSSATGHISALKGLAALTLVMLAVHPDGCLWYILATLRDGICSAGDGLLTLLVMIGDGDIPSSIVVTGALLGLLVATREIRRLPAEKVPESTDALGSSSCPAGKSVKGRNKKGKKGKGRGSGRGRIRHQQSRTSNQNQQQQQQQYRPHHNTNRHGNSLRHQSSHSLKSSASSQMSVSSLEEQKIQDLPGRSRLESSDVSDADPSPPTSGNSDPPVAPTAQDMESSSCVKTGSALKGVVAAGSLASDEGTGPMIDKGRGVAPQSELLLNPSKKKKYSRKKEEAGPTSTSLSAPVSPRTPIQASASSSGSHHTPRQSQRSKGGCTPVRKSKGPKVESNRHKPFSVESRNRIYDQPKSSAARPARHGNERSASVRPHAHYKAKQKQSSFTTSPKDDGVQKFGKVEGDPWQSQARAAESAHVEKPDSLCVPLKGVDKSQNNIRGGIKCDRELPLSSPGRWNQSVLRPPPGLAPLLDTARSPGKDVNSHQSIVLPPIGHDSTPIGGDELSGLGKDRSVLGIQSLQSDHTDGFLSRTPLLGTDPARARCLSGDDMSVFSVGTSSSAGIPPLSPLPQSTYGLPAANAHLGGIDVGGSRLVADMMDDDDRIEADLQELGGQMVGSVLD